MALVWATLQVATAGYSGPITISNDLRRALLSLGNDNMQPDMIPDSPDDSSPLQRTLFSSDIVSYTCSVEESSGSIVAGNDLCGGPGGIVVSVDSSDVEAGACLSDKDVVVSQRGVRSVLLDLGNVAVPSPLKSILSVSDADTVVPSTSTSTC